MMTKEPKPIMHWKESLSAAFRYVKEALLHTSRDQTNVNDEESSSTQVALKQEPARQATSCRPQGTIKNLPSDLLSQAMTAADSKKWKYYCKEYEDAIHGSEDKTKKEHKCEGNY